MIATPMLALMTKGFLLGAALTPVCLGICLPLLLPYFFSESRPASTNFKSLGWFLSGRLAGYLAMGGLAGWLGQAWLQGWQTRPAWEGFFDLGLGTLLAVFTVVRGFPNWSLCRWVKGRSGNFPGLMGLLTGLSTCPPFLGALAEAGQAGGLPLGPGFCSRFFSEPPWRSCLCHWPGIWPKAKPAEPLAGWLRAWLVSGCWRKGWQS